MPPDKKPTIAENEAQDAPLTQEEYDAQMLSLNERARAAGLNPMQALAHTYVRQGAATVRQGVAKIEDFLMSLEGNDNSKKKKE